MTERELIWTLAQLPMRDEPSRWEKMGPFDRAFVDSVRSGYLHGAAEKLQPHHEKWLRDLVRDHGTSSTYGGD